MSRILQLRFIAVCSWAFIALGCANADPPMSCPRMVGGRGYLPQIGPPPLRFRAVADRAKSFIQLPPPEPVQASSVPTSPSLEPAETADPFALTETLAPVADTNSTNVMEAATPAPAVPPPAESPISPHLFMRYFNGGAMPPAANPSSQVEFTPPRTAPPSGASPSTPPR